ncbi:YeeE/YedE thiosulfate transporter family protein [Spirochaetota bacterium]
MKERKLLSPYIAGVVLGLVLLASFFISGRGLGASGAFMRSVVAVQKTISQEHVNNNTYLAKYGGGDKKPMNNWLVFEIIGVLVGALVSGAIGGRLKRETVHGPRFTDKKRWIFALSGGVLFGFGARLARGCTSGVALSGGATLALGSWVTMMAIFAGAYAMAYFVRKQWI